MRQSKLFGKTSKTVSENLKAVSHKYLHQGGFIRESVAGRYYFLPLGMRVRDKVIRIIEEEMNKRGAQKIITPILHPKELWKETNRTESVGFELMIVKDRRGSEFVLGGTAEEMIIDLVRKFNISYKDLPFNIYQFSQKFRDELRARGGLLRVREFLMKDAYSFHADEKDFKKEYQNMWKAYEAIFAKMGLETVAVESDNGYIGGEYCHEFVVENTEGESRFLVSDDGQCAVHEDIAVFKKEEKNADEKEKELQEIKALRGKTMEDGVKFHQLPIWQQIKDVMFVDNKDRMILAIIRGDLDVNEVKLMNLIGAGELRHATDEEIRKAGSEPGFISPVGISKNVLVAADDSLRTIKNAYGGANKKNADLLNVNIDRDYKPNREGDIAMAHEGYLSPAESVLTGKNGIEVGNIFQLGYYYSEKMKDAVFTDKNSEKKPFYMGCYGIGIDRTIAAVAEMHHDEKGIVWPEQIAPFQVHLIGIIGKDKKIKKEVEMIYGQLQKQKADVLYDDREDIGVGAKFADADLIGCPYRVVISSKTLEQKKVELKKRNEKEVFLVSKEELFDLVKK